ncbi:MAG TPA: outer membrane beta-barrel protein [Niabella sp.]|nr:outer membrane beta-barrel protein [Niabella sp.]HQW15877.1 outer membrane beta-barrel protein [Niabella sp.]HQX21089.1 outer membrane beta-barrel protein [Niabella sp.]HQX40910.1 outer membrane beta-barrel protein [Niabella sp.]HRB36918.1 outer membrane beta-barrel protein [Niabella sp.]
MNHQNLISLICIFCLIAFGFLSPTVQAQETLPNSPVGTGQLKGKVKDSTYNFMLTSATIAVYKAADSSLLQYGLPNNFGEFSISSLPIDTPLRLIITHVGYRPLMKKFSITPSPSFGGGRGELDMGLLYMHQLATDSNGTTLEEVVVKAIPPMRMNGDTLEFNADAFRMKDANATAEDWMRILPGLTIWGDGEITYNGKKIQQILVEGKPFMGSSDPTIATQNLPKEALDKLQVYQQRNEKNPLDSTMFANIKLKEDKKMGYFGKLSAGAAPFGSVNRRYAMDGMLSGFNKKLQISTAGAFNNINKLAGSMDVLMRNTTYKSEGANIEYQSDFGMRGLNKPLSAGVELQYDFIPDVAYQKSSRLNGSYFMNRNDNQTNNHNIYNQFITADTVLTRSTQSNNNTITNDQSFSLRYGKSTEKMTLNLNASINLNNLESTGISKSEQEKTGQGIISNSLSQTETEILKKYITAGFEFNHHSDYRYMNTKRIPEEYTIGYQFSANDNTGHTQSLTQFQSAIKPTGNKVFDRLYEQQNMQGISHNITASYPELKKLIFNKRGVGGIEIGLSTKINFDNNSYQDKVLDKDSNTQIYRLNRYLSNSREMATQNWLPAINLSKTFYKGLTNRYNKWVSLQINLRNQYFSQQHHATQSIQNFSRTYSRFIPDASVEYNNHQYGSYEVKYSLRLNTSITYPGVHNIAPLVDSANFWYVPKGNPNIRPQYRKEIKIGYQFYTRTPRNPLQFHINAGFGQIDDNISDSTLYDNAGVRTVYAINVEGNRFTNADAGLQKSIELKKNTTLELNASYAINKNQSPQYINQVRNTSNSTYQNIQWNIGFRFQDLLTLKAEQGMGFYDSEQKGFNDNRFKNTNQYLRFVGALHFPKSVLWGTNITYNKSSSNHSDNVYFTIWNASLAYRFLKGNRGEVKFSALDLLHQNKSIVNTATGNTQTFISSNVLQQYFMLTLSYYPRKFGK